ncbi:hypothetical protein SODALDRAFT_53602 [Sodiomyces alkalinus F11]|uniref:BZIP domain-containing protein n=1 Tax=Sodiomyces alkalinus (strain CBS 110278 / VKM F-3762 / F11) TaxID=1314773 RepID=A0A3N2PNH5_SODAK|nr:hypothetical protein SODALDRAFT_53602 [Sodiomyces alkalinus F11]ROT35896.1 hypothetical protein SODALDRAFT_53602 [Sodiomyces alkalinus F11]
MATRIEDPAFTLASTPKLVDTKGPATRGRGRSRKTAASGAIASTIPTANPARTSAKRQKDPNPCCPPAPPSSSSTSSTPSSCAGRDDKKAHLRQRNREAARKCRVRKQRGIEDLQSNEAAVTAVHQALAAEATMLRSEVLMLKNMVLQHGGCGCPYIQAYIEGAASRLLTRPSTSSSSDSPVSPRYSFPHDTEADHAYSVRNSTSTTSDPPRMGSEGGELAGVDLLKA